MATALVLPHAGLNANEWENNIDGIGKTQLQQNIYGGGIGGPVIKNKTSSSNTRPARKPEPGTARTVYTATAPGIPLREGRRNQPAGAPGDP
jgi:hypothetical protein